MGLRLLLLTTVITVFVGPAGDVGVTGIVDAGSGIVEIKVFGTTEVGLLPIPPPKGWGGNDPHPPLSFTFPGGSGRRGVEGVPCKGSGRLNVMDGVGALSKKWKMHEM